MEMDSRCGRDEVCEGYGHGECDELDLEVERVGRDYCSIW